MVASAASVAAATAAATAASNAAGGRFGRLWGRGYERLLERRILSIQGTGATPYLQNLVTSNLLLPPTPPNPEPSDTIVPGVPKQSELKQTELKQAKYEDTNAHPHVQFNPNVRSTCFLDPKGRVLTDSLLWKVHDQHYYVDVPATTADLLLSHLKQYQMRKSAVTVTDASDSVHSYVVYGTLNSHDDPPPSYFAALDPRHPSLGLRILQLPTAAPAANAKDTAKVTTGTSSTSSTTTATTTTTPTAPSFGDLMGPHFPECPGNYALIRRLAGVAEGRELTGRVALETNQELLQAVAFDKGCYLGQELTARVHHTGVLRKRILPLMLMDTSTQVPHPWIVASSLQADRRKRTFYRDELTTLPSRLPRLSVCTAANLVAITTGSIEPAQPAVDEAAEAEWAAAQQKTQSWMERLHKACHTATGTSNIDDNDNDSQAARKLIDVETGETIGQLVAPPLPGTNVILALMRLEAVGLVYGNSNNASGKTGWSKTNKIRINNEEFRYLPYLPLWWPELSIATGKAKRLGHDDDDNDWKLEAKIESEETNRTRDQTSQPPPGMTRIEMEEIPFTKP